MANVKISQLPSLSTMTDLAQIPVVASGTTYQITGSNLSAYFSTSAAGSKIVNGTTEANIGTSGGNANISVGGISNVAVFTQSGVIVSGVLTAPVLTTNNIRSDDSSFVNIEDGVNITGAVIAAGNVVGNYFIGNGSQLTGVSSTGNLDITGTSIEIAAGATETIINISPNPEGQAYIQVPNDATANATNLRIHNDAGNIEFGTNSGSSLWYFDNTGNLTIPNGGNINFVNTGGITQALNEDLKFTVSDDEEDGWAVQSTVNDGAGNDLTRMQVRYDGVQINTDLPTNNYNWTFRDSGEFDVPKSIRGPAGGNLVISIGDQFGSTTFIDLQTRSYVGDALISNIRIANPNVTVSTSSGAYNWTFDGSGNLNLPPSGNIVGVTANNTGYINWLGNSSGDGYGYTTMKLVPDDTVGDSYLILDPTAPNHIHIRAGGAQDNSGAQLYLGGETSHFKVDNGLNPNVYVTANNYVWTFGLDGNLTLPGDNVSTAFSRITSLANSSGDGFGYTTLGLIPDINLTGSDQYLIIDPTAPGHIHIRAGGTQDASSADLFLGGENTYFKVNSGANSEARISANSYSWIFGADSILTVPNEGVIRSIDDTITLQSFSTAGAGNIYSARLGTNGGLYLESTEYASGWMYITNNSGNANIQSPSGNIVITPAFGVANGAGKILDLRGGDADQSDFYTGVGGNVNITGGLGSSNDGGGGGPGGSVNITAGVSSDPAGHAGNVKITSGSDNWIFDYTGNLSVAGHINNLSDPVQNQDAATKYYVDTVAQGLNIHQAANLASTQDLATYTGATVTYDNGTSGVGATLSLVGNTLTTLDGTAIPASASTRLLIKNQANAVLNGVYNYTSSSLLTRTTDTDTSAGLAGGDFLFVTSGSTQADTGWIQTTDNVVVGTSNVAFSQFSSAGAYAANTSAGLALNGSIFSAKVDDVTTAFDGSGNIIVKASANLTTPNIGAATGSSLSTTGNVTGGNLITAGAVSAASVSASGNITGGNIITSGASGNISGANVISGTTLSATGNITGGNLVTAGAVSAASVSASGNVTGGNILTGGLISSTGNITGGNILGGANVNATTHTGTTVSVTGNVTGGNANITSTTASTSKTTGALTVGGGIGVAGDLYAGNSITVDGGAYGNVVATQFASLFATGSGPNPRSILQVRAADGTAGIGIQAYSGINGQIYANTGITFTTGSSLRDKDYPTGGTTRATLDSTGLSVTGIVSASGNVTGGNLITAGAISAASVSASGNITGGNVTTAGLTSTASLSITGNTATVTSANYSIGYLTIPQVTLSANATAGLTDSGKHLYSTTAGNLELTIPDNANVAFPVGTAISIVVQAAGNVLVVTQPSTTLYLGGNATSGNRVVGTYGMATIMKVATNTWFISGTGVS